MAKKCCNLAFLAKNWLFSNIKIGSLCRFGGALNAAAEQFSDAFDANKTPMEFVVEMKKKNEYIMGIGHR